MSTASIFTTFWNDQIAAHNREGVFLVLVSFLLSFLFIRTSARMTRSVSWWPGGVQTESGVHLHHLVWGICLILVSGVLAYSLRYESPWYELTAIGFGIGAGLTLDEFALWVYLQDVYWADQGRKSLDAVAIATVFMGLVFLGLRPFDFDAGPAIGVIATIVIALVLVMISFLKERLVYGMVGIFITPVALVGAVRLGKPGSPWAKWRYGSKNPGKQARSRERFDDPDRRANRIKDKLFNAIGGRPTDEYQERERRKRAEDQRKAQERAIEEIHKRAEREAAQARGRVAMPTALLEDANATQGTRRLPPGPRSPVAVQLLQRFTRPGPYSRRMSRRYGHVYMMRMPGGQRVAQISDPAVIKQIFTASPDSYEVGTSGSALLEPLVGTASLLILDGTKHISHRKLLLPPLHGDRMRGYGELMVEITKDSMRNWPRGRPFPIHPPMREITLDVILRAVFGVADGERHDELREQLRRILDLGQNTIAFAPWIRHWMHRPWVKFLAMRERVDDLIYREIARRRAEPNLDERDDILSLLLSARYEDGSAMSDKELRDELITMLVAGHETTATALAWAFDLLLHDRRTLERLLASLDDGDEYLDAVITETLRIRPVIAQISRMTVEPFELGPYTVPAGTLLATNIALVHRRADLYPQPEVFRPERFLGDGPETYSWLPFGGGVRRCAGAAFATFEMRTVLRTVLAHATLRAADPEPEQIAFRAVTQAPKNGTVVIMDGLDL